jgi:predicted nuclease of predicted toxin-antitoxin system
VSLLKFYTDTHIDKQVAMQLRQQDIDVIRCEDVGLAEADDETHLVYAAEHGYALITKDVGFQARHFQWLQDGKSHGGIFFCSDRNHAAIGKIVSDCAAFAQLVETGAGTVNDIKDQFIVIKG